MPRMSNILVGVDLHHGDRIATDDLAPAVHAALEQAIVVAEGTDAQITLCTALEISEHAHDLIEVNHETLRRSLEDVAQSALQKLVQSLAARGVTATAVVRFGHAWEELTRQAIVGKHDMVIVGTRSRNPAARWLFGSTAHKLIRYCPVPVWIAKPEELRDIREILVASDFSDAALAATKAAVTVVQAIPSKLYVVHALEFPFEAYLRTSGVSEEEVNKYRQRLHTEARQKIEEQVTQTDYRTLQHGVKIEVLEGTPDVVIPKCIVDYEVDLLVIGTHGRTGVSRMLLGNTAERLLPHVHCSLLAVKPASFVSPVQLV